MSPRTGLAACGVLVTVLGATLAGCSDDETTAASGEASPAEPSPEGPASELHVTDPADDVLDGSGTKPVKAPEALVNVDALGADLARTGRALRVTVTYADLDLEADGQWGLTLQLKTSEDGDRREIQWERGRYADTGEPYEEAGLLKTTPEGPLDNPCPRLSVAKDQDARTVTLTVPDRCLGDPEWLRVVSFSTDGNLPGGLAHFQDDLLDGPAGKRWPRLFHA